MKKTFYVLFSFLALTFWLIGSEVAKNEVIHLVKIGAIDFGPLPNRLARTYDFSGSPKAFHPEIDLKFVSSIKKDEFKQILISSTHRLYRDKLDLYIDSILTLCEEYKVDPFWVLSVVTVESGFNPNARSHKNAKGLMQVRPDTAKHLSELLNRNDKEEDLYQPEVNLELGVFYLKKLLQNFRYRYDLATIAYNVGPNSLRRSLVDNSIDLSENNYLRKVNSVYLTYLKSYSKIAYKRTFESKKSQNIAQVKPKNSHFKLANLTIPKITRFYYSERL